jgi:hypothetical protein
MRIQSLPMRPQLVPADVEVEADHPWCVATTTRMQLRLES